ncbi:PREDICTED: putative inactive disease susceptibility protein LOV1 [Nicotiana attenuata]|uniref:putative inactive disease susceptibility protein LOV1 n=1 Tax=Nicotiana attenuata TaxID=49451 RepID=UPI000904BC7B|nr:PREDICTED: putative inactive disease susceptibility protein LOV1 [Nicotiana attenuata]
MFAKGSTPKASRSRPGSRVRVEGNFLQPDLPFAFTDEVKLLEGTVEEFKSELLQTKGLVKNAKVGDERVIEIVDEFQKILVETEDVIDTYTVDVGGSLGILKCVNCISTVYGRRKLESQLVFIMEQIHYFNEKLANCCSVKKALIPVESNHTDSNCSDYRFANPFNEDVLVGLEEKKRTLQSLFQILVTTRNGDVAKNIAEKGVSFEMKRLSADECWEVLLKRQPSFLDFFKANQVVEEIAKAVVSKCFGLPLAVVCAGSVLAREHSVAHWKSSCFLYLGLFPKGVDIEAEKLFNLWVAEGFVASENGESETTLIDRAEHYLYQLVARNLICMQEEEGMERVVRNCPINDLLREHCLLKGKEENVFQVLHLAYGPRKDSYGTTRILSVFLDECEAGNDVCLQKKVSSLRNCYVKELPSFIGEFSNLRTLDLRVNDVMIIPNVLWKLKKLRHLYLPYSFKSAELINCDWRVCYWRLKIYGSYYCDAKHLFNLHNLCNLRYLGASVTEMRLHIIVMPKISSNCTIFATWEHQLQRGKGGSRVRYSHETNFAVWLLD